METRGLKEITFLDAAGTGELKDFTDGFGTGNHSEEIWKLLDQ